MNIETKLSDLVLCINCFNCKIKDGVYYCKEKRWIPVYNISEIKLSTPYDFDCENFQQMD